MILEQKYEKESPFLLIWHHSAQIPACIYNEGCNSKSPSGLYFKPNSVNLLKSLRIYMLFS